MPQPYKAQLIIMKTKWFVSYIMCFLIFFKNNNRNIFRSKESKISLMIIENTKRNSTKDEFWTAYTIKPFSVKKGV